VISIIALLMSILMPALDRLKKQARTVICQSNLHEWGIVFTMYVGDNHGRFPKGWTEDNGGFAGGHEWPNVVWDYYRDAKLRFCPTATKSLCAEHRKTFWAWIEPDEMEHSQYYPAQGSYGKNEWCSNPPFDISEPTGRHSFGANSWRTASTKGAGNIPLMSDCCWAGGFPLDTDTPPQYPNDIWLGDNELRRWCINRHGGYINIVFMDNAVAKTALKQLWRLKWGRAFNTHLADPTWPNWMLPLPQH